MSYSFPSRIADAIAQTSGGPGESHVTSEARIRKTQLRLSALRDCEVR